MLVSLVVLTLGLPAAPAAGSAFQGQNGKIVYTAGDDVFTVNPDGSGVTNLTEFPGLGAANPSASPDGKRIAFNVEGSELDDAGIYVINMDGTGAYDVLAKKHDDFIAVGAPTWSNDGRRIAFEAYSYPGFSNELFVVNADGTNLRQLTNCNCVSTAYPVWSPVADEVAFVPCCSSTITVLNVGTKATREVFTGSGMFVSNLTWSPDGTQLAFDDLIEVYKVNSDGTGLTSLTATGPGYYSHPSWSPDGTQILVESNHSAQQSNNQDIHAIDAAAGVAGGITRITSALDTESEPEWAPLCTSQCNATYLVLRVTKTKKSLKVAGEVEPGGTGNVAITLSKKTKSGWKKVKSLTVGVGAGGAYSATFPRPDAKKCKLDARYGGDADYAPSTAGGTFNC